MTNTNLIFLILGRLASTIKYKNATKGMIVYIAPF